MAEDKAIECMLLRWGESPAGRTVTLLLRDDTGPTHPFKGLRTGTANGQRLGCAFVLISDDESTKALEPAPQAPEKPAGGGNGKGGERRAFTDMPRAQQAGILCNEVAFSTFLGESYGPVIALDDRGEIDPAATLRYLCAVESRRELDTNQLSGKRFDQIVREYRGWKAVA